MTYPRVTHPPGGDAVKARPTRPRKPKMPTVADVQRLRMVAVTSYDSPAVGHYWADVYKRVAQALDQGCSLEDARALARAALGKE